MKRLMELLTVPLGNWAALQYPMYAEWVGVRAKVALLQAHAQCATIRKVGDDGLCAAFVEESQKPFEDMLLVLWRALLQDYVMLETQPAAIHEQYTSTLYGEASPAILRAVQPYLATAAPAVLGALSKHMPRPEALLQSQGDYVPLADASALAKGHRTLLANWDEFSAVLASVSDDKPRNGHDAMDPDAAARSVVEAWAQKTAAQAQATAQAAFKEFVRTRSMFMYASTMDIALTMTAQQCAAAAEFAQAAKASRSELLAVLPRLRACLSSLQRLMSAPYLALELCSPAACSDALHAVVAVAVQVLSPLQRRALRNSDCSLMAAIQPLTVACGEVLKELGGNLSADHFAAEPELATVLMDATLAVASLAVPFSVVQGAYLPAAMADGGAASVQSNPALASALLAAQNLMKNVPPVGLAAVSHPLLQLGVRLLCTVPMGVGTTAAQRYLENGINTLAERIEHPDNPPEVIQKSLFGSYYTMWA